MEDDVYCPIAAGESDRGVPWILAVKGLTRPAPISEVRDPLKAEFREPVEPPERPYDAFAEILALLDSLELTALEGRLSAVDPDSLRISRLGFGGGLWSGGYNPNIGARGGLGTRLKQPQPGHP